MNRDQLIRDITSEYLQSPLPDVEIGDTVGVHVMIKEGDKERVQVFTGTVIARKGGRTSGGITSTITVRRLVGNEGVERTFPVHSPTVQKVEVKKKGHVRRSKLY